ncbi:MAG: maleylpyruvate isomerase family mycothiol-dependent enzyme [Acidimicrobiales bacterium]
MDDIVGALAEQHAELRGLVSGLDEPGWQRPSRCDGWSVADVVLHLAQTDDMAIASLEDRFDEIVARLAGSGSIPTTVDDAAAAAVAAERRASGAAVLERWEANAARIRQLLLDSDPGRRVTWVAGTLSARTLAATRLAEYWIHTGDVADAFDLTPQPAHRLRHIARLAWRTLPYAFERGGRQLSGPVAFDLRGPGGEPWRFAPDDAPTTTIRGDGLELCLVAARRVDPADTSLGGEGPDVDAVLELVRTYA